METVKFAIALILAKIVGLVVRVVPGLPGELPGRLALKICPDYIEHIEKPTKVVMIAGSNGKTTIARLIHDSMEEMEISILINEGNGGDGAAVAETLTRGVTPFGREKYATAVIEIDESKVDEILPYIEPDIMLIPNLSRETPVDSGNPDRIQQLLTQYIPEKTKLIVNGDDLLACGVSPYNTRKFFGINQMPGDKKYNSNLIDDNPLCPMCKEKLAYVYNRYSNMGKAYCPECGYQAPEYDFVGELVIDEGRDVSRRPGKYLKISTDTRSEIFPVLQDSVYNLYNQLAAVTTMVELGSRLVDIKNAFSKVVIDPDRTVHERIGNINIFGLLCKERNAYAVTRVFEYITSIPGDKEIILMNNSMEDARKGTENISWLYDCDFEVLRDVRVKTIVVYGNRGLDIKLRMLLAGIDEDIIHCVKEYDGGVDVLRYFDNDRIYVLYGSDSLKQGKDVVKKIFNKLSAKEEKRLGDTA